jgi:hypothetical protein
VYSILPVGWRANILQDHADHGAPQDEQSPMGPMFFDGGDLTSRIVWLLPFIQIEFKSNLGMVGRHLLVFANAAFYKTWSVLPCSRMLCVMFSAGIKPHSPPVRQMCAFYKATSLNP